MKAMVLATCLIAPFILSGCENDDIYPLTGEECGPDDPVKTLDAADCTVPGAV